MPNSVRGAYSIRYEESFVLVGGNGNRPQDTLLKYQPESDTWMELPSRLKVGRTDLIAILVDVDIFPECQPTTGKMNKT